ncbi:hypothetical protein [Pseudobythopirellula maris]|uniref:hypothetical protein n=1 Tax=Pseudobythopirellula maris TaxID=2527991 RepID=UPI0011B75C28|nr:hypothetical protein [Pseudobythopirellula maris]
MNSLLLLPLLATGCGQVGYNLPPAQQMMHPGPGVGGPGPGVIPPAAPMGPGMGQPGTYGPGGYADAGGVLYESERELKSFSENKIEQVQYCESGACSGDYDTSYGGGYSAGAASAGATTQIAFVGSDGMQISWDVHQAGMFDSAPLFVPSRQDFPQGAIYRLKLQNIPGRAEVTLYPTLEVAPVTPRTDAYLAHAPVPVQFTEEDLDQVTSGNYVTKVIYLPDPEFQELALSGVETLVSTRLDPGVDPISEADRRGSILAILRIGNKDLGVSGGYQEGVTPAQYSDGCEGGCPSGQAYGGQAYGGPANVPMGMPTAGMAPPAMPPHMMAGMGPQYGMPYTGTPIGLPGPPHIPLGSPAGLKRHVMKNRTRVHMPGPTEQMMISVKQRPGMNYPKPVNNVRVDEVHRAPARIFNSSVPGPIKSAIQQMSAVCSGCGCDDGSCGCEM